MAKQLKTVGQHTVFMMVQNVYSQKLHDSITEKDWSGIERRLFGFFCFGEQLFEPAREL